MTHQLIPGPGSPGDASDIDGHAWQPAPDDLELIVADVWNAFLDHAPAPGPTDLPAGDVVRGLIHITGEWYGTVVLEAPLDVVVDAAEGLLGAPRAELSTADVSDAWGELTNIVGGNVKSLIPGVCGLSLPVVSQLRRSEASAEGSLEDADATRLLAETGFRWHSQPLVLRVWDAAS